MRETARDSQPSSSLGAQRPLLHLLLHLTSPTRLSSRNSQLDMQKCRLPAWRLAPLTASHWVPVVTARHLARAVRMRTQIWSVR